jgi:hypothetical protein
VRALKALRSVEKSMSDAWRGSMRSQELWTLETGVTDSLLKAFDRGRMLYWRRGALPAADPSPFVSRGKAIANRAVVESAGKREKIAEYYGYTMLATLFLLFFDEEDSGAFRPLARGIPSSIARRAARSGVAPEMARRAQEIVANDPDVRLVVRTLPRVLENQALDEARRAFNLGIVDGTRAEMRLDRSEGPSAPAHYETDYPLWRIKEVMDNRTRGNPLGLYPHDGHHWQVNGYVNVMEEIVRQGCVPPCGRNCRAILVPVGWREAGRLGLITADGDVDRAAVRAYNGDRQGYIDRGQYPDARFASF